MANLWPFVSCLFFSFGASIPAFKDAMASLCREKKLSERRASPGWALLALLVSRTPDFCAQCAHGFLPLDEWIVMVTRAGPAEPL